MIILYLMKEFIIMGCLAIGGGMVIIPFIQNIATNTGWITEAQIVEMIAISEITPGPLAVNMATYIRIYCYRDSWWNFNYYGFNITPNNNYIFYL